MLHIDCRAKSEKPRMGTLWTASVITLLNSWSSSLVGLQRLTFHVLSCLTSNQLLSGVGAAPSNQPTKYIVLDHVERIADTDLLANLLRAKDITGMLCHKSLRTQFPKPNLFV